MNILLGGKKDYFESSDISLARNGDKDAYVRVIRGQKIMMYRVANSILYTDEDVEDAISESILKAYANIHKLRKNEYFKSWLIKILMNECFRILKKDKKDSCMLCDVIKVNDIIDNSEKIDLYEAIKTLNIDLRIVTILFYFEDMKYSEIAKALHIKEGTVKSRLYRAKHQLKKLLNGDE